MGWLSHSKSYGETFFNPLEVEANSPHNRVSIYVRFKNLLEVINVAYDTSNHHTDTIFAS